MKKIGIFFLGALMALLFFCGTAVAGEVFIVSGGYIASDLENGKVEILGNADIVSLLDYGTRLEFCFMLTKDGEILSQEFTAKDKNGFVFFIDAREVKSFFPAFEFPKEIYERSDKIHGVMGVRSIDERPILNEIQGYDALPSPYFVDQPIHAVYGAQEIDGVMVRKVSTIADIYNPVGVKVCALVYVTVRDYETDEIICEDFFVRNLNHPIDIEAGETKHISVDSFFADEYYGRGYVCAEIVYWGYYL